MYRTLPRIDAARPWDLAFLGLLEAGLEVGAAGAVEHLAHLGLAFPLGPVDPVQLHEAARPLDHLLARADFKDREAADHLLGLAERAVGQGDPAAGDADAKPGRSRQQ